MDKVKRSVKNTGQTHERYKKEVRSTFIVFLFFYLILQNKIK